MLRAAKIAVMVLEVNEMRELLMI